VTTFTNMNGPPSEKNWARVWNIAASRADGGEGAHQVRPRRRIDWGLRYQALPESVKQTPAPV
jgi:hypothetical protein